MPGHFECFCQLLIFFKINFFPKFFQEYHQSVEHAKVICRTSMIFHESAMLFSGITCTLTQGLGEEGFWIHCISCTATIVTNSCIISRLLYADRFVPFTKIVIFPMFSTSHAGLSPPSRRGEETKILNLNVPLARKVVCFFRLLKCLRSLYGKQCGPRSGCLFWVHAVCFYT